MSLSNSERDLFLDLASGELRRALHLIHRFPREHLDDRAGDCGRTGRELALEFLERALVIESVVRPAFRGLERPITIEDLGGALEEVLAPPLALIASYDSVQWNKTVAGKFPGERARRAELLWEGLRDFRNHSEHFAAHLQAALQAGVDRSQAVVSPA